MRIKKLLPLIILLLLAVLAAVYYSLMQPRVSRWLHQAFPTAEMAWDCIIPIPIINKVYIRKPRLYVKGEGPEEKGVTFACDSLFVYRDFPTLPGGSNSGDSDLAPLIIHMNEVSGVAAGADFMARELVLGWNTPSAPLDDDAPKPMPPIYEFVTFSSKKLRIFSAKGLSFYTDSLEGRGLRFRRPEHGSPVPSFRDAPWLFLLQQRAVLDEVTLTGAGFEPISANAPKYYSKITISEFSNTDSLSLRFAASSEMATLTALPSDTEKDKRISALDSMLQSSSIVFDISIPWTWKNDETPTTGMVGLEITLPDHVTTQFKAPFAPPDKVTAASWLDACAHNEPPFVSKPSLCLRDIGFDHLSVTVEDRGIAQMTGGRLFSGGGIPSTLEYSGRHAFYSAFLALAHVMLESMELSSSRTALAIAHDITGPLHPFRQGLVDKFIAGEVLLQPGPDTKAKKQSRDAAPPGTVPLTREGLEAGPLNLFPRGIYGNTAPGAVDFHTPPFTHEDSPYDQATTREKAVEGTGDKQDPPLSPPMPEATALEYEDEMEQGDDFMQSPVISPSQTQEQIEKGVPPSEAAQPAGLQIPGEKTATPESSTSR